MTLLARKGVSANDYVQNPKSFCKELPSTSIFYLKLDNEDTSDEGYEHARNVWALFEHKTIKDYNDLYLQSDVSIFDLLMYLRILEKLVPPILIWIQHITTHLLDWRGMHVLNKQVNHWNRPCHGFRRHLDE